MEVEAPEDDRPPIADYLAQIREEHTARSADVQQWLVADAVHRAAVDRHVQRLLADHAAEPDSIGTWFHVWAEARHEAVALAAAEGFPPPGSDDLAAAAADEPDDDAPALPRATAADIEWTRATERAARPARAPAQAAPLPNDTAADRALWDAEVRSGWERAFPSTPDPALHSDGV